MSSTFLRKNFFFCFFEKMPPRSPSETAFISLSANRNSGPDFNNQIEDQIQNRQPLRRDDRTAGGNGKNRLHRQNQSQQHRNPRKPQTHAIDPAGSGHGTALGFDALLEYKSTGHAPGQPRRLRQGATNFRFRAAHLRHRRFEPVLHKAGVDAEIPGDQQRR